jgi:acyl-CoA thioester hydrolase
MGNKMVTETHLIVRYAETDKMGIVHHSNYAVWFEAGRTDFIKKAGITYSEIEQRGVMLPLIELKCKFKVPAHYEDEIVIKTRIEEMTNTRIRFYYEAVRLGDMPVILSTGETMHVWTDKNLKPVNLKKYSPELFGLFCNILGQP